MFKYCKFNICNFVKVNLYGLIKKCVKNVATQNVGNSSVMSPLCEGWGLSLHIMYNTTQNMEGNNNDNDYD